MKVFTNPAFTDFTDQINIFVVILIWSKIILLVIKWVCPYLVLRFRVMWWSSGPSLFQIEFKVRCVNWNHPQKRWIKAGSAEILLRSVQPRQTQLQNDYESNRRSFTYTDPSAILTAVRFLCSVEIIICCINPTDSWAGDREQWLLY